MIAPRRLLLCLVFSLTTVSLSSATNYFVTQSGSGANTGLSQTDAWSVSAFNASSAPKGGDTVVFSGTITSTVTPKTSGSSGNLLTLDFSAATLNTANPRISITGKNFLDVIGGTFGTSSSGTLISFGHTIHNGNVVEGWTYVGAAGGLATPIDMYYPQNFTVKNNSFDNVGGLGYSDTTNTHDILITGNFVRTSNNTVQQTDVITLGDAYNVTIEKNKLVNQAPGSATNGRHNDVIQTFQSGSSPNGHPTNWIIRYNWIEAAQQDGSGGNMSWHELENFSGQPALQIYGNVYVGSSVTWNGGNGISIHSGTNASDTYYFYNNTVMAHQSPLNPVRFGEGDGPGTLFFRNNAISSDISQTIQATFSPGTGWNNNFFNDFSNCSGTYSGSNGSCSLAASVLSGLVGNSLTGSSSLAGAGDSSIGSAYNQGVAPGATWPNPQLVTRPSNSWDAGAYQTGGTAASNPPNPPLGLQASVQ